MKNIFTISKNLFKNMPFLDNELIGFNTKVLYFLGLLTENNKILKIGLLWLIVLNLQQYIKMMSETNTEDAIVNTYYASSATNVIFKIIFFILNRKNILNFLKKMDLITNCLRKKDGILIQTRITKNIKYGKLLSAINYTSCTSGAILFCLTSFLSNRNQHNIIYSTWAPFDQYRTPFYELTCIFQIIITFYTLLAYVSMISIVYQIIIFSALQFTVISMSLDKLFKQFYTFDIINGYEIKRALTRNDELVMRKELNAIYKEHLSVLDFIKEFNIVFNLILSFEFGLFTINICVLLFNINTVDNNVKVILQAFYLTIYITVIFLLNYHVEFIKTENDELCKLLYSLPWYLTAKEIKILIHLILMRTQKFNYIIVANIFPLGLESFLKLINSSYSYFTMVQTMIK